MSTSSQHKIDINIHITSEYTSKTLGDAAALIREYDGYIRAHNLLMCIAGDIEYELGHLEVVYPRSQGGVFVGYENNAPVGCVALEKQAEGIAEIRRLYVRDVARGKAYGRALIAYAVAEAKALGYEAVRLDTFRALPYALAVYKSLGFIEIPAYNDLPQEQVIFLEKKL